MSTNSAQGAYALLDQANECVKKLLPPADGAHTQDLQTVQATAAALVEAVAGMQQYLKQFASCQPSSRRQQLEQEVQSLQQELSRAEHLLLKTDHAVQGWQSRCQDLRTQHEAALTDGISTQQGIMPAGNT